MRSPCSGSWKRLSAAERAALVLRQAFDYSYAQIAEILSTNEPAVRKLVSRARGHLGAHRDSPVDRDRHRQFFNAFMEAAKEGDVKSLERLLTTEVVSYTDGGGMVHRTARRPVIGRPHVTAFLHGVAQWFWDDVEVRTVEANGRDYAMLRRAGYTFGILGVTATAHGVTEIMWMMNPSKLTAFLIP